MESKQNTLGRILELKNKIKSTNLKLCLTVFFIVFCRVACVYKTEEALALIWSSGLIIMIRGKRAI